MANVTLAGPLRPLAGGQSSVRAAGGTIREVIADLERQFPGLVGRIVDSNGIRPEVFIALAGQETDALDTAIGEDAEIHVMPAIAGGEGS